MATLPKLGGALLIAAAAACPAVEVVDDARVQRGVEAARTRYLAEQPFDRVDLTVLVRAADGRWRRGAVNGEVLSYPASCMKLAVLAGAVHWCAERGRTPDCLDGDVRPMIEVSDDFATGRVIDAVTGTTNVEPDTSPGYESWFERRLYVERLLAGHGLLGGQRLLTKTYPSNSSEMPIGFEHRAWKGHGRNAMSPDLAARLMLTIVEGELEPQARDYMRSLLRRDRFTAFSALGPGLPPGSVFESKIGNAFDVLAEIAHAELPNGDRLIIAVFTNGWDQQEPQPYDVARLGPLADHLIRELGLTQGLPRRRTLSGEPAPMGGWRWRARIPASGRYELLVSYPKLADATSRAVYEITHGGGTTQVEIDQRFWSQRWVRLGSFAPARGTLHVEVRAQAPGSAAGGKLSVARWP